MPVLFKNADITIYNHYYSDEDKYKKTVIKGVNWQGKRNTTVSDKGVNVADTTLVFIDKSDSYIKPKAFNGLVDKTNNFTFNVGDKFVKGVFDFEVTKIADLEKTYDNVVTIMTITECSGHWEVECK